MSAKINVSNEQVQALEICAQLLDVGSFSLSGKELAIAAQAKAMLSELIQSAKAQPVDAELVEDSGPKRVKK
jgi:hypothetical protein